MRGVAKDGRPRNFANDHKFLAHEGSCDALAKRT